MIDCQNIDNRQLIDNKSQTYPVSSIVRPTKYTAKETAFIADYITHGNATLAAKNAGYSIKTAADVGCRLLKQPKIKSEICRLQAENLEAAGITAKYTLGTIRDIIEDNKVPGAGPAKHQVALRGAELLGKHQGLWESDKDSGRSRRAHELTDKELIALGMELAQAKEPKQIDAAILTVEVGNKVGIDEHDKDNT